MLLGTVFHTPAVFTLVVEVMVLVGVVETLVRDWNSFSL